jgi:polysaccharide export outer membrane protein
VSALKWLCVAIAVTLFAGCASSNSGTDAGVAAPAEGAGSSYIIGPGDSLNIFVWRNPELSVTVPVRPDGKISAPLVEDMAAAGKSPTQLSRDIEAVLAEYVREPNVTVIVGEFVGQFTEQIRVVGQATEPRSLPYRDRMTVLDAMIEVGGLTPQAAGNRAKIVRWDGGMQVDIPVRLHDLLNKGKIDANVLLRPGDVLIIPESVF